MPPPASLSGDLPVGLAQLTQITEIELQQFHGMRPKGIELARQALQAQDLSFAQQIRVGSGGR